MSNFSWTLLLSGMLAAVAACDARIVEPPGEEERPARAHAQATSEPSDAEVEAALSSAARIIELTTGTTLTSNMASAFGFMRFVGTGASLSTAMRLYKDDNFMAELSDRSTYEAPFWQVVADAVCLMQGGECSHTLGTEILPVYLSKSCGHHVSAASNGSAWTAYTGKLLTTASDADSSTKTQFSCAPEPEPDGGGGGGSDYTCPGDVVWSPWTGCESSGGSNDGGGGSSTGGTSVTVCRSWMEGDALIVECVEYYL